MEAGNNINWWNEKEEKFWHIFVLLKEPLSPTSRTTMVYKTPLWLRFTKFRQIKPVTAEFLWDLCCTTKIVSPRTTQTPKTAKQRRDSQQHKPKPQSNKCYFLQLWETTVKWSQNCKRFVSERAAGLSFKLITHRRTDCIVSPSLRHR